METAYDWITVGIFAGLVVLFMQRSTSDEVQQENDFAALLSWCRAWVARLPTTSATRGCTSLLSPLIIATLGFIIYFLRPFKSWPKS